MARELSKHVDSMGRASPCDLHNWWCTTLCIEGACGTIRLVKLCAVEAGRRDKGNLLPLPPLPSKLAERNKVDLLVLFPSTYAHRQFYPTHTHIYIYIQYIYIVIKASVSLCFSLKALSFFSSVAPGLYKYFIQYYFMPFVGNASLKRKHLRFNNLLRYTGCLPRYI